MSFGTQSCDDLPHPEELGDAAGCSGRVCDGVAYDCVAFGPADDGGWLFFVLVATFSFSRGFQRTVEATQKLGRL